MKKVGILFKLQPGKKAEYIKRHDEIWPEVTEALSAAGIKNFTIWNEGDMLFSYYEVDDPQRAEQILGESEIYQKWRDDMENYVYMDPDTRQKEWFLDCVFAHE